MNSRKKNLVPISRDKKEIVILSNPSRKRAILKAATKAGGTRTKRKVLFDDDRIEYLETPKKRAVYPNKSKQFKAQSKSISTVIYPKNENHGPLKFQVIKKIGSGSYGDVFQVGLEDYNDMPNYFPQSNNYALKKMLDPTLNRAFEYEQAIMNEIKKKYPKCSPHVLCYFDIAIDNNGIFYLLSEMQEGDLKDIYKLIEDKDERSKMGFEILYQSLLGLKELKSVGLLHRDIKMDNILYSTEKKNGNIIYKLADFGLSCSNQKQEIKCGTGVYGTAAYISPKVILLNFSGKAKDIEELWDETDDIYSLAAMMYEFIFKEELMTVETFKLFTDMFSSSQDIQPQDKLTQFVEMLEQQYEHASKVIQEGLSSVDPNGQEARVYQFVLRNINPFGKKQTINQALKSLTQ